MKLMLAKRTLAMLMLLWLPRCHKLEMDKF